jgi:HAD superfamily hydrolase (TIGR01509 family)
MPIAAVIFDLDGVLVDSEALWAAAREQVTREHGGSWREQAARAMMGMSSPEWSRYMHESLEIPLAPDQIAHDVLQRLEALYRRRLPLIEGAQDAVRALSARWPLGLASSANRTLIDLVLELAHMRCLFATTVSAEEVARGKPAPDVYLQAALKLSVCPSRCAAVEDSTNGLVAAAQAGMRVIAVPNREFPPSAEALARADLVIDSLHSLGPHTIEALDAAGS